MSKFKLAKNAGVGCIGVIVITITWFAISQGMLGGGDIPGYSISKSKVKYKYFNTTSYLVQTREMPDADPSTFEIISETYHRKLSYGKDKDLVYFMGEVIEGADPKSFVVTSRLMSTDGKSIFRGNTKLKNVE